VSGERLIVEIKGQLGDAEVKAARRIAEPMS
jgi:hypothetical protein